MALLNLPAKQQQKTSVATEESHTLERPPQVEFFPTVVYQFFLVRMSRARQSLFSVFDQIDTRVMLRVDIALLLHVFKSVDFAQPQSAELSSETLAKKLQPVLSMY